MHGQGNIAIDVLHRLFRLARNNRPAGTTINTFHFLTSPEAAKKSLRGSKSLEVGST
jgi:hypothetical protein